MNPKQIRLACIVVVAIMLMLLFPPYDVKPAAYPGFDVHRDFGYAFIGGLPERRAEAVKVHIPALSIQIACFLVVGGLLWFEYREH